MDIAVLNACRIVECGAVQSVRTAGIINDFKKHRVCGFGRLGSSAIKPWLVFNTFVTPNHFSTHIVFPNRYLAR